MSSRAQLAEQLSRVRLFSRCDRSDLRTVAGHLLVSRSGPGVELVVEGETGNALYVLLDGTARVYRGGDPVGHLGPGDYFGELALLHRSPRAATVVTTTESEVAVLGSRIFNVLLRDIPQLSIEMLAQLAEQLRTAGEASTSAEVGPLQQTPATNQRHESRGRHDDARIT